MPDNWLQLRQQVFRLKGRKCLWKVYDTDGFHFCHRQATDVDHIRRGDDHSVANLRPLCSKHHNMKSSQEGHAAKAARRKAISQKFRRQADAHPAYVDR